MEQLQMKKTNEVYSTPKRIGTMKNGKRKIGVAGYGLEEILNGGRMFHEHPKGFPAFHVEALALEKMVDDKWKRFEIKDSFLSRPKKLLRSFQVKDEEQTDINNETSIYKRKSAELFIPSYCGPSSFSSEVPYRRV
jgi:hypothetical protein